MGPPADSDWALAPWLRPVPLKTVVVAGPGFRGYHGHENYRHLGGPTVDPADTESEHMENLASYRRCAERIQTSWPGFVTKREQRLEQQRRLGEASEKVAENILEDLFTTVLDWPLADFNNQVEHADIVLTDHGIKRLVVEVKRPGSLAWSRCAVESALAQAMRYAGEQKVKAVAVSDGLMLYAANIAEGGLRDRVFVSLSESEPPPRPNNYLISTLLYRVLKWLLE